MIIIAGKKTQPSLFRNDLFNRRFHPHSGAVGGEGGLRGIPVTTLQNVSFNVALMANDPPLCSAGEKGGEHRLPPALTDRQTAAGTLF